MAQKNYQKIGEVNGRWKAEIIEGYLKSKGIDAELVQEAMTHYLYKGAFDLVHIYVPDKQAVKARVFLISFDEFQVEEET